MPKQHFRLVSVNFLFFVLKNVEILIYKSVDLVLKNYFKNIKIKINKIILISPFLNYFLKNHYISL